MTRSFKLSATQCKVVLGGYWLFLFAVTHVPLGHATTPRLTRADKAVHFVLYFVLTWCVGRYLVASGLRITTRRGLYWVLFLSAYAAFDEWLQQFVRREMSLGDWVADVVGVLAAAAIFHLFCRPSQPPAQTL